MPDKPYSPKKHPPSTPQGQKNASVKKQGSTQDRQLSIIKSAPDQKCVSAPLEFGKSRDSAIRLCDGDAAAKEETGDMTGAATLVQQDKVHSNEPLRSEAPRGVRPQSSAAELEKDKASTKQKSSLGAHRSDQTSSAREDDHSSDVKQQRSRSHPGDGLSGAVAGQKRKTVESLSDNRPSEAYNSLNASELSGKGTDARDASLDDLMDDDNCSQHVSTTTSPQHRRIRTRACTHWHSNHASMAGMNPDKCVPGIGLRVVPVYAFMLGSHPCSCSRAYVYAC